MTTQITVRLPEDLVEFVDETVRRGESSSRAATVARALEWERRRQAAESDARIYAAEAAAGTSDDDLDALAAYSATLDLSDLD